MLSFLLKDAQEVTKDTPYDSDFQDFISSWSNKCDYSSSCYVVSHSWVLILRFVLGLGVSICLKECSGVLTILQFTRKSPLRCL